MNKINNKQIKVNNKNVYYRRNSVKANDQIFLQIKKTLFLDHIPTFSGKKVFRKNLTLSSTTS